MQLYSETKVLFAGLALRRTTLSGERPGRGLARCGGQRIAAGVRRLLGNVTGLL